MSPAAKLAGFATALAVLFGAGAAAGGLIDADPPGGSASAGPAGHGMGGSESGDAMAPASMVRGLSVADRGVRLVVEDAELRRGRTEQLRFRIVDDGGRAVRDFDVEHTKRMHLIVARRDLGTFQHLHPEMGADGTWTTPLRLADAGSYRVFADFSRDGTPITLAGDLRVDGDAALEPLPAPATTAKSDGGYDVRLDSGASSAGRESELRFTVTKDARPVEVEPYLGADGHLVALRDGDLAFLHVHPTDHGDRGSIGFESTFPTTGRYRLFLQFKHEGRVQTVAFTQEVK
jgi:hypothetical protein